MTKYPFHSSIKNVTDEQFLQLVKRQEAGEFSKLFLVGDTAYYQKASKHKAYADIAAMIEPFAPGPTDPADRRVPRTTTPAEASSAYQTAAALEPDYSDEDGPSVTADIRFEKMRALSMPGFAERGARGAAAYPADIHCSETPTPRCIITPAVSRVDFSVAASSLDEELQTIRKLHPDFKEDKAKAIDNDKLFDKQWFAIWLLAAIIGAILAILVHLWMSA